ncbi:MAG: cobalamin B12-binding domain-containing protein [Nitrospirae bacterium]|nr:cobalamin B12-binding domain-containing protein [Nitrospirota bacterium]
MSIDLLLIDPPLSMTKRYGHFAICGGKSFQTGLACIAAVARRDGFKVRILDMGVTDLNDDELGKYLDDCRPRIVGLTAPTIAISDAARVAGIAKRTLPGVLTVIGGPHISCAPEATIKRYSEFDVGVIGEGEITMLELLHLSNPSKDRFAEINGLIWKKGNEVSLSQRRELIKDLDWLPLPAVDLFPDLKSSYIPPYFSVKRTPAVTVMTTRGCPGQCTFCTNEIHGRVIRQYSLDYLFEYIYLLTKKYGIKEFQINDDTFTVNRKRVMAFCQRLIDEKIDLTWSCLSRVTGVTPEMLELMKQAGCWQICYGIESGDQAILDSLLKSIKLEQVYKTTEMTKKAGIGMKGYFMMGMPRETHETLKKTIDLALELPLDDMAFTIFTPYPGSPAYRDIHRFGTFAEDWDAMTTLNATFVAEGFTREELIRINQSTYRRFYFRPRIILSYLKRMTGARFIIIMAKGMYGLLSTLFIKRKYFEAKNQLSH